MKLAISLATRGRPQQVVDTIRRSVVNWVNPNTELWVMADEDDRPTIEAIQAMLSRPPPSFPIHIKLDVRPREDTIADKWNRITSLTTADLYLVAADDDPYTTAAYDAELLKAASRFPDGIGMVYGHNANASFSCLVAPTVKLVEKMGWLQPPLFPYWFVDHWTDDLARLIGRVSFADVRTDQSRAGKTQEMREPAWWATFFDACYLIRRKQAHTIIQAPDFKEQNWRKEILLRHHPMIEFRSRWINDSVRAQARQLEQWAGLTVPDERYKRVRQRAVDMIPGLLAEMDPQEAAAFRAALLPAPLASAVKRFA